MFVIGTAGHVDHGKSTLVKALTGIDPDRLKEEKEREMTIDLGFAWLTLPSGREVSIVDVPGHERLVRNMLAGVGAIDLALLVVAGDESVMPQTREHLAILDLLEVRRGVVVITKRDLVDPDWLDLVAEDVRSLLRGTTLEGAPIVPVSSVTGEGLEDLVRTLDALLKETPPRPDRGRPRLAVDRAFVMPGFGTVVTGTLVDGSLRVGQEVELVPSGRRARIRGLQSHRRPVEVALPGRRTAVNLSGVEHTEVERGEVLTLPGLLRPTVVLDARLRVVREAPHPLRHNMGLTFHIGTDEVVCRVRLLDREEVPPGGEGWAQIHLPRPVVAVRGDRFILRTGWGTLGGGVVVDPHPRRHRRLHSPTLERLKGLLQGGPADLLLRLLEGRAPVPFPRLVQEANLGEAEARRVLTDLAREGRVVVLGAEGPGPGAWLLTADGWRSLAEIAQRLLAEHHRAYPLRRGLPREELRSRLGLDPAVFPDALRRLAQEGVLEEEGSLVRRPGYTPRLTPEQERQARAYLSALSAQPYSPPTDLPIDPDLLNYLVETGQVVRVSESVVFTASAFREMVERIVERARAQGRITVAEVRDLFGTSRKYALALMEFLDQQHITRRVGDERVLVRG